MNPLTQRARTTQAKLRKENNLIAWGCGIVLAALVVAFLA
jgi:hypothetical protein